MASHLPDCAESATQREVLEQVLHRYPLAEIGLVADILDLANNRVVLEHVEVYGPGQYFECDVPWDKSKYCTCGLVNVPHRHGYCWLPVPAFRQSACGSANIMMAAMCIPCSLLP